MLLKGAEWFQSVKDNKYIFRSSFDHRRMINTFKQKKKQKKKRHILLISKYKDFSKLFENSRENSLVSTSEFSDKLKFRNKLEFIYKSQSAMWLWRTSKNDKNSKILKWKFEECGTWWHDSFLLCLGLRFDWREPWWPMSYGNAKYCSRNHRSHSTKRF